MIIYLIFNLVTLFFNFFFKTSTWYAKNEMRPRLSTPVQYCLHLPLRLNSSIKIWISVIKNFFFFYKIKYFNSVIIHCVSLWYQTTYRYLLTEQQSSQALQPHQPPTLVSMIHLNIRTTIHLQYDGWDSSIVFSLPLTR